MLNSSIGSLLVPLVGLPAICLLTLYLRSFFDKIPPDEDFGLYFYYPFFGNRGVKLVSDLWPDFPFTIYYLYMAVARFYEPTIMAVRRSLSYFNFLLIGGVYCLVVNATHEPLLGLCGALIFGFYFSEPKTGTYFANTESLMLLTSIGAVFSTQLFLSSQNPTLLAFSGLLFGLGTILKPITIVHMSLFSVYLLFFRNVGAVYIAYFISIFFLPILICACVEHIRFGKDARTFWQQVQTRYSMTLTYRIGSGKITARLRENLVPIVRNSYFLWFSAIAVFFVLPTTPHIWTVWLLAEITLLFAQGVFWDYHFTPFIPILSALSASFFTLQGRVSSLTFTAGVALLIHDLLKRLFFLTHTSPKEQIQSFKKHEQLEYAPAIGSLIREHTEADERIFVWGHMVQVYLLSERAAEDSYLFYISPPYTSVHGKYFQHMLKRFRNKAPAFILLSRPDFNIRYLEELTGASYCLFRRFGQNMALYKRAPSIKRAFKSEAVDITKLTLDPGIFYNAAALALEKDEQEAAWKHIRELLKYKPMDAGGLFLLAIWLKKEKRYSSAILVFEKFLEQKPYNNMAHLELAKLYLDKYLESRKRTYAARVIKNIFAMSVATVPENYNILCDIEDAWCKIGRYNEAEEVFKKAARCGNGRLRCYYILGKMFLEKNKVKKALSCFESGLRQHISLIEEKDYLISILYNSGSILRQAGEISKAEAILKECIELCPEHKRAKEMLLNIPNCNKHMLQ